MVVTAVAVLAAPLIVTGFAVGGVSVGDAFEALGVGSPNGEPGSDRPPREDAGESREAAPQHDSPESGEAPRTRPVARNAADAGAGSRRDVAEHGKPEPSPAESRSPKDHSEPPEAAPQEPPAEPPPATGEPVGEDPGDGPLDKVDDILEDPVGGAKDTLEELPNLLP
jgi:hypothetical protein